VVAVAAQPETALAAGRAPPSGLAPAQ